jgi:hypothetical protein
MQRILILMECTSSTVEEEPRRASHGSELPFSWYKVADPENGEYIYFSAAWLKSIPEETR